MQSLWVISYDIILPSSSLVLSSLSLSISIVHVESEIWLCESIFSPLWTPLVKWSTSLSAIKLLSSPSSPSLKKMSDITRFKKNADRPSWKWHLRFWWLIHKFCFSHINNIFLVHIFHFSCVFTLAWSLVIIWSQCWVQPTFLKQKFYLNTLESIVGTRLSLTKSVTLAIEVKRWWWFATDSDTVRSKARWPSNLG